MQIKLFPLSQYLHPIEPPTDVSEQILHVLEYKPYPSSQEMHVVTLQSLHLDGHNVQEIPFK